MSEINLRLTAAERKLLCNDVTVMHRLFISRIRDTPPDADVSFQLWELNEMLGAIGAELKHCKDRDRQLDLADLMDKIQDLRQQHLYGEGT